MRILHIHNINRVAETFGRELVLHGHSFSLYHPDMTGSSASMLVKVWNMPKRLLSLRDIIRELRSDMFDIAHIHWASYGVLGLTSDIPFVIECHGDDVRHRLNHPLFRLPLRTFLQKASAVICITPDLLSTVRAVTPDVFFIPGPIDTTHFAPDEDKQIAQARPCSPRSLLLFTRLDPDKGCEIAVQGIERFSTRHPDVHVRLLAWGALKHKYGQRYRGRFEFITPVAPDEVYRLIQSADIIVGQMASGALGLSELQAMSCAKPVITSFRYDNEYPTPPPHLQATNAEEIEQHLEYLYQHPEIGVVLGQKARAWILAHHSTQILTNKLEELYDAILRQGKNRGKRRG